MPRIRSNFDSSNPEQSELGGNDGGGSSLPSTNDPAQPVPDATDSTKTGNPTNDGLDPILVVPSPAKKGPDITVSPSQSGADSSQARPFVSLSDTAPPPSIFEGLTGTATNTQSVPWNPPPPPTLPGSPPALPPSFVNPEPTPSAKAATPRPEKAPPTIPTIGPDPAYGQAPPSAAYDGASPGQVPPERIDPSLGQGAPEHIDNQIPWYQRPGYAFSKGPFTPINQVNTGLGSGTDAVVAIMATWVNMINWIGNGVFNEVQTIRSMNGFQASVVPILAFPPIAGVGKAVVAVEAAAETVDAVEAAVETIDALPQTNALLAALDSAEKFIETAVWEAEEGSSGLTWLYQKLGAAGEHLKYGITINLATRYSLGELAGGTLSGLTYGSRPDMLALERELHMALPLGPEEQQLYYFFKQVLERGHYQ